MNQNTFFFHGYCLITMVNIFTFSTITESAFHIKGQFWWTHIWVWRVQLCFPQTWESQCSHQPDTHRTYGRYSLNAMIFSAIHKNVGFWLCIPYIKVPCLNSIKNKHLRCSCFQQVPTTVFFSILTRACQHK